MKSLAARRHDRRAPLVLLALALVLTGVLYAVLAAPGRADAAAPTASQSDVDAGAKLFQANCATCHGMGATGTAVAPSLVGSARRRSTSRWAPAGCR